MRPGVPVVSHHGSRLKRAEVGQQYAPYVYQMSWRGMGGAGRHDIFSRIPRLTPPIGGEQRAMGGSGGGDSAHATATLTVDLEVQAVADHYRAQLDQAGWARGDTGQAGPAAWSTHTFTDEDGSPWRGSFFLLQRPRAPREYMLQVWVEADTDAAASPADWAVLLRS
jgi:hypothetical protein